MNEAPSPPGIDVAEVVAVGTDFATVYFASAPGRTVVTRLGAREISSDGPHHLVTFAGLEAATDFDLEIEGQTGSTEQLPATVRTLDRPPGARLATFATVNDVHFGETVCGMIHAVPESELGPWVRARPGEDPYPITMNRAAVVEIEALGPAVVLAKGDLTCVGSEEEYAAFLDTYGRFGDALLHVRGNHDAMLDPTLALEGAPYAVEVGNATLAVLDTVRPTEAGGQITRDQLGWLETVARATSGPVFVFGHHQIWDLRAKNRPVDYFGVDPDSSEAFAAVVGRCSNIVGYFAGHTHRNRIRRFAESRDVPFVEIGAVKEYMGVWAEYQLYEGGYTQLVHRVASAEALDWSERTRYLYGGIYPEYSRWRLDHRCFTYAY
ncbi:MAG: metallophosphoesterase [Acidimicrobiia bacterium]